jgi:RNA polymerase sigma factor (sigma-70 family)
MVNGHKALALEPNRLSGVETLGEERSDGQLLSRFTRFRDESAFAALVHRHGPMVLGVCRRVLRHTHDAEDAFQATFLVLAQKAGSLARPSLLAAWLHGVAYRTALHARARAVLGAERERKAASMFAAASESDTTWGELRDGLDEELQGLPEFYRAPLVLCYLQGKTNVEAAALLGWPPGSMSARLNRARAMLRDRLASRTGTSHSKLPLVAVLGFLLQHREAVTVPASLLQSTVQAGLQLAAGKSLALGMISGPVQALIDASLQSLPVAGRRWLRAAFVVLAAVLLGLGAAAQVWGSDWPIVGNLINQMESFSTSGSQNTEAPVPPPCH